MRAHVIQRVGRIEGINYAYWIDHHLPDPWNPCKPLNMAKPARIVRGLRSYNYWCNQSRIVHKGRLKVKTTDGRRGKWREEETAGRVPSRAILLLRMPCRSARASSACPAAQSPTKVFCWISNLGYARIEAWLARASGCSIRVQASL